MKTENKSSVTEALEMIELNLKQFPNAFLALNGTWGECIKALEKQIPKKPDLEGDGYCDGQLVYDTWICPCCEERYEVDYDKYDYCPNCGQAIDWSEENAE